MQKGLYRSGDITLTGIPPVGGWNFSWQNCCRPGSITNVPGSTGYLLRAVMYPYTPPGATGPLSAGDTTGPTPTCYDSSPNFLEDPLVVACQGTDITYNSYGFDPDFRLNLLLFCTTLGWEYLSRYVRNVEHGVQHFITNALWYWFYSC